MLFSARERLAGYTADQELGNAASLTLPRRQNSIQLAILILTCCSRKKQTLLREPVRERRLIDRHRCGIVKGRTFGEYPLGGIAMEFAYSEKVNGLLKRVNDFMDRYIYPNEQT